MKTYCFIIYRLIKKDLFSLESLLNFSVLTSTFLCVFVTSITLSITSGFKNNITSKIIKFDGFARLSLNSLSSQELEEIQNSDYQEFESFYSSQFIIKSKYDSELINFYATEKILDKINNLTIYNDSVSNNGVFIGKELNDQLFPNGLKSTSSALLINKENNPYNIVWINGVFDTGVSFFDKHFVLSKINDISFYDVNDLEFIISENDYKNINQTFKDKIVTYKERYFDFLKWLDSFDLPIFILLMSLVLVSLVNNSFCFKIEMLSRKKNHLIMNSLGLSNSKISLIYSLKLLTLNLIGVVLGLLFSISILIFESKMNFIQIPVDIYFTSIIPINFDYTNFIIAPLIILLQSLYFIFYKKINYDF